MVNLVISVVCHQIAGDQILLWKIQIYTESSFIWKVFFRNIANFLNLIHGFQFWKKITGKYR